MKEEEKFWTIPNVLSVVRIGLIPVFIWVYFSDKFSPLIAASILIISGLTDFVDGYIARHYNQITKVGKLLDPLADKLTQATICICLYIKMEQVRFFVWFFIIKEFLMLAGSAILLKKKLVPEAALWFGKIATFLFYVVMILIIGFPSLPLQWVYYLFAVLAFFMLLAFVKYFIIFINKIKEDKGAGN